MTALEAMQKMTRDLHEFAATAEEAFGDVRSAAELRIAAALIAEVARRAARVEPETEPKP